MTTLDLFQSYQKELEEDTKLDELNLKEAQLKLPGLKHKWVGRLMQTKRDLYKLNKLKKETQSKLLEKVKTESRVDLSDVALTKKIDKSQIIIDIDEQIEDLQNIVLYLEKVEVIFRNMSFDIKNIIEIQKLEQL